MSMVFLGQPSLTAEQLTNMGGKARHLHFLLQAGLPVPAGFVVQQPQHDWQQAIEQIGGFPVAVRSSGAMEDLANASFAGLYETYLFVNSLEELAEAVKKCFASSGSERVEEYLKTKKISYTRESLKMSVLVQKMISPEIAGVLFTLNPINGLDEECYLEFCSGVAERLVSGHVTPSQIRYDWKNSIIVEAKTNSENTVISNNSLENLINHSLVIQAYYGEPQDIEWAIDKKGSLHILQSRPVTSYGIREDTPELTNADFKDGGVSARVCTPVMFSLYRDALQVSMGDYFKKIKLLSNIQNISWIYFYYGRVYWNVEAVKKGLKNIPGYKEVDFDRDLGIQKNYGKTGSHHTPVNLFTLIRAIPILLALYKEFDACEKMVEEFKRKFEIIDENLKQRHQSFSTMSDDDFHVWFKEVIAYQVDTERKYFRTIYNNSNFQTEYKSFLKKNKKYVEGDDIDLMGNLQGIAHLDVQTGLANLAKVEKQFGLNSGEYEEAQDSFLKIHYHHGPAELDLTVQRWGENKIWVDELVTSFSFNNNATRDSFTPTFNKLASGLSNGAKEKFSKMTERCRHFLKLREEMRCLSTRAYYLLRLGLLEFARRTKMSGNDVFLFDIQEIQRKLTDPSFELPGLKLRKLAYEGYRNFIPPNEFGGSITQKEDSLDDGPLKGLGCSPGEFTGRARVITDIHKTHGLTKEDILITLFTDPGWTPVLGKVGGVVTEVGGLLSHAAVIGREYGIPAILNLNHATKLIRDGSLISINGKTGVVKILEEGPES